MPTLAELETELGLTAGTLTSKPEVATKWNGILNDGQAKLTEAQRLRSEADTLQATIDDQIAKFGITESTNTALETQVAMLQTAVDALKKKGIDVTDIKIPEIKPAANPEQQFRDTVVRGFTQVGQTLNVQNRYWQVFGKPMPDAPAKLADEAAAARMSIEDFAEKKYGFAAEAARKAAADAAEHDRKVGEAAVAKYQEAHPSNAGHPELNGGLPSNYPKMPAPRDGQDLRSFSQLPAREKIRLAQERANAAAKSAA